MKLLAHASHYVLWLAAVPWLLLTLVRGSRMVDLQLHDTYIVTPAWMIYVFFVLLLGLLGGVYWLLRHQVLVNGLTIIHTLLTAVLPLVLGLQAYSLGCKIVHGWYLHMDFSVVAVILLFLLVQLMLLGNVVYSLLR